LTNWLGLEVVGTLAAKVDGMNCWRRNTIRNRSSSDCCETCSRILGWNPLDSLTSLVAMVRGSPGVWKARSGLGIGKKRILRKGADRLLLSLLLLF
jgi:hypothetical protein